MQPITRVRGSAQTTLRSPSATVTAAIILHNYQVRKKRQIERNQTTADVLHSGRWVLSKGGLHRQRSHLL